MAAMRPAKALTLLGVSPILHTFACPNVPTIFRQDVQSQRSPYSTTASPESFNYRIAASFSPKGHRFNPKQGVYSFDLERHQRRNRAIRSRVKSGQDAFFVSGIGNSTNVAFGVADGVGGWSESGIDSAHFSHGLCGYLAKTAENTEDGLEAKLRVGPLLQKAYDAVLSDLSIPGGGSTACIAIGQTDGNLEVAKYDVSLITYGSRVLINFSLGDSGFVQLRPNAVHYSSQPQTHAFNTPYQLSMVPPKILARMRAFGGQFLNDFPRDASISNHKVKHGDVLIFATDGVWDNLNSTDVLKLVSRYMVGFNGWTAEENGGLTISKHLHSLTEEGGIATEHESSLQSMIAVAITGEAKIASMNTKLDGPFAREVQKFYPRERFHGGKVDDICVVVAVVVQDQA